MAASKVSAEQVSTAFDVLFDKFLNWRDLSQEQIRLLGYTKSQWDSVAKNETVRARARDILVAAIAGNTTVQIVSEENYDPQKQAEEKVNAPMQDQDHTTQEKSAEHPESNVG